MGRPKNPKSIATEPWEDSKERSNRIERRVEVPLVDGYRCLSQAHDQAERMVDNKKHLKKSELNKIKAECKDDCCHPNEELRNEPSVVQERLVYEHKRMRLEEKTIEFRFRIQNYYGPENYYSFPGSSRSATSSAIPEAATEHSEDPEATKKDETAIRNAATDHSEKRRLLAFANENSQSGEAVTERSEIPGIACQEAKRPRKSEKETKRSLCADTVRLYKIRGHTDEDSEYYARIQEAIQEALSEIPKEKNATVPQPEALDAQCRPNRKATLSRKYSEPTLRRIHRRKEVLLNHNYTCKSQALYQAESHIVSDTLLTQIELDRIRADCRDKCCNPPSSSGGATPIPEAATKHSESPKAAKTDKTAIAEAVTKEKTQIPEAATEHSESSKATKEDKTKESRSQYQRKPLPQPKKAAPNTKGSSSQNQRKPLPIPRKRARTASPDPEEVRG